MAALPKSAHGAPRKAWAAGSSAAPRAIARSSAEPTLYDIIGADPSASSEELKKAIRRSQLESHPDKGGTSEAFLQVSEAYKVLSDSARRVEYDREVACKAAIKAGRSPIRTRRRQHRTAEQANNTWDADASDVSENGFGDFTVGDNVRQVRGTKLSGWRKQLWGKSMCRGLVEVLSTALDDSRAKGPPGGRQAMTPSPAPRSRANARTNPSRGSAWNSCRSEDLHRDASTPVSFPLSPNRSAASTPRPPSCPPPSLGRSTPNPVSAAANTGESFNDDTSAYIGVKRPTQRRPPRWPPHENGRNQRAATPQSDISTVLR